MDRIPDVSNFQPNVDWAQVVRSGRAGGICKATESMTFVDGTFKGHWAALKALGARRGAYCFARPSSATPEQQAAKFISVVAAAGRDPADLLILDLEVGDGNLDDFALRWLGFVERQTGTLPWFYSYGPFIRAHLSAPELARYPLWLAAYTSQPPAAPPPWAAWTLWQFTDSASIPGIPGKCDESQGTLPAPVAVQPAAPIVVIETVHDFEESSVKQALMHIGPLDANGCGWATWQPGFGRDPIIVGVTQVGPSPADDGGYWMNQAKVNLAAQPRGGSMIVVVRNGTPGDTVSCWVAAA